MNELNSMVYNSGFAYTSRKNVTFKEEVNYELFQQLQTIHRQSFTCL